MAYLLVFVFFLMCKKSVGCPYQRVGNNPHDFGTTTTSKLSVSTPSVGLVGFCLKTNGAAAVASKANTCSAYNGIAAAFLSHTSNANISYLSNFFGKAIRVAFHDAAEADLLLPTDVMGPDGCLSNDNDNAGLVESNSLINSVFNGIWQNYCDQISRGDFWALLAKLSIEQADPTHQITIPFQFGRVDSKNCSAGRNRLPDAEKGLEMSIQVFVDRLKLTLNETVALIGAHTIGHVHPANSGYGQLLNVNSTVLTNAWDNTPSVFDNHYFQDIFVKWVSGHPLSTSNTVWTRGNQNIFLNSDITLGYNASLKASDLGTKLGLFGKQACSPIGGSLTGGYGCNVVGGDFKPPSFAAAHSFAASNAAFLAAFQEAFPKLTTVGYGLPANTDGATATGKLGTLTSVDLTTCPVPSSSPTSAPPTISNNPSFAPFKKAKASVLPTASTPSYIPTTGPLSILPSRLPTSLPSNNPSVTPTVKTTSVPTVLLSAIPSASPTNSPSYERTIAPSFRSSPAPTGRPSNSPSLKPITEKPSFNPSNEPFRAPTNKPTYSPSTQPSTHAPIAVAVAPTATPIKPRK